MEQLAPNLYIRKIKLTVKLCKNIVFMHLYLIFILENETYVISTVYKMWKMNKEFYIIDFTYLRFIILQ